MLANLIFVMVLPMAGLTEDVPLPIESAVVFRPATAETQLAFEKLPSLAILSGKPATDAAEVAKQILNFVGPIESSKPLYLYAAGPFLDGPDSFQVKSLTRRGNDLIIVVRHTSARLSGVNLRRNVRWRPLVQVPISGLLGNVRVLSEWTPYESLTGDKPLGETQKYEATFKIEN